MEINKENQDVNHFLVTILHISVTEELIGRKLKHKSAIKVKSWNFTFLF